MSQLDTLDHEDWGMSDDEDEAMSVGIASGALLTLIGGGAAVSLGHAFVTGAVLTGGLLCLLAMMGVGSHAHV